MVGLQVQHAMRLHGHDTLRYAVPACVQQLEYTQARAKTYTRKCCLSQDTSLHMFLACTQCCQHCMWPHRLTFCMAFSRQQSSIVCGVQATIGASSSVTSSFSAYFALTVGTIAVVVHALCPVIRHCRGEPLPHHMVCIALNNLKRQHACPARWLPHVVSDTALSEQCVTAWT